MSDGIAGPESVELKSRIRKNGEELGYTSKRFIHRKLIQDSNALWNTLNTDYGFRLKPNIKQARMQSGIWLVRMRFGSGPGERS